MLKSSETRTTDQNFLRPTDLIGLLEIGMRIAENQKNYKDKDGRFREFEN